MRLHRRLLARLSSALLLAGAFVVLSAARADASLIVYVCNDAACSGAGDFTIQDDGVLDSNFGTPGSVTFFTAGGGTVTASSYPNQGAESEPFLNLTYSLSNAAFASFGGTPFIYATQDGFTAPGNASFLANATNGGGTASLFAGAGTGVPSFGAALINCPLNCGSSAVVPASPYYLAVGLTPVASARGASGDATAIVPPTQSVPDGGSTATLLGSVLLGFGVLRRKFNS